MILINILPPDTIRQISMLYALKFLNEVNVLIDSSNKQPLLNSVYILKPLILDVSRAIGSCKIIDVAAFKATSEGVIKKSDNIVIVAVVSPSIINGVNVEPGSVLLMTDDVSYSAQSQFIYLSAEEL